MRDIVGVRRVCSELELPPGKALPVMIQNWARGDREHFEGHENARIRLNNPDFTSKVPAVVAAQRANVGDYEAQNTQLNEQIATLERLE